ncbi:MAG: hypothetical protein ACK5KN_17695 [Dysgonomonas sp.]|uniref:hypothetical protein n=1 Tax=Dysgonomonas sp. TaxID=1891233 RepID=UPI003A85AF93
MKVYTIGQTVKFKDVTYGMYQGVVTRIRKYNGRTIVYIKHDNGDSYQFFYEDLNQWN